MPEVVRLSCSVFLSMLVHFRRSLKAEIGVFFPMLVLKCIESATGIPGAAQQQGIPLTFNNLALVLRVIKSMAEHGDLLLDIFVNYDCDIQGANLYERMVRTLIKLALGGRYLSSDPNSGAFNPPQVAYIRVEALAALVRLVQSHWEWLGQRLPNREMPAGADAGIGAADLGPEGREPSTAPPSAHAASAGSGSSGQLSKSTANIRASVNVEDLRNAKAQFQEAITVFNAKPKKGLAAMQSQGLVGHTALDVARFLRDSKGLSKTSVGEYLGEGEPFPISVMHEYIDLLDFTGVEFDDAIRALLDNFRLPGEAQKIDRIIEKFSERRGPRKTRGCPQEMPHAPGPLLPAGTASATRAPSAAPAPPTPSASRSSC